MTRLCYWLLPLALLAGQGFAFMSDASKPIVVGSKNFTESYILAELIAQTLEGQGYQVERRFGLGGTLVCYAALTQGEIDIYPEYTGTLSQVILKLKEHIPLAQLRQQMQSEGIVLLPGFGFNNTYAIALLETIAHDLRLQKISDLRQHPNLRLAFSHEFLERNDGWMALSRQYGLTSAMPSGIEHGLAYQALKQRQIDVTDAYSTDGEILRYKMRLLEDDKAFFPTYLALPVARQERSAELAQVLASLAGVLDEDSMQALNARVTLDKVNFSEVLRQWRAGDNANKGGSGVNNGASGSSALEDRAQSSWLEAEVAAIQPLVKRHLQLSGLALLLACLIAIPLAVVIHTQRRLAGAVMYLAGLLQTVPSIAMLALFIPWLGIGVKPAITALMLYSLLPILRNAVLGLVMVDTDLIRIARGMGMTTTQRLRHVTIPLAMPNILAGIRTAAVISIGTATLAAFIGAGGLGEPIVTGLALNDPALILRGAVPAALLAIVTELVFELIEVSLVPAHLRRAQS